MTKKRILLNENVIRRWGKLAAMPALTENWLEEQDEEAVEDVEASAEDEIAKKLKLAQKKWRLWNLLFLRS